MPALCPNDPKKARSPNRSFLALCPNDPKEARSVNRREGPGSGEQEDRELAGHHHDDPIKSRAKQGQELGGLDHCDPRGHMSDGTATPSDGRERPIEVRLRIAALWAATMFADALKSRGITIGGEPQARDSRVAQSRRLNPSQAVELGFVTSKPLSEIAKKTNKESNNLYAELILRTLGRERGETAALPEAIGRERGDDETGLAVIRSWLARSGVSTEKLALHDGSGLSRLNLVTPESTTHLLRALSKTPSSQVFMESLPLSGRDGTLAGRLKTLTDRVSAKTGSLTYDNSLSGYLTAPDGQVFAFSIICNDQTSRSDSTRLIDQIIGLVAAGPELWGEKVGRPK